LAGSPAKRLLEYIPEFLAAHGLDVEVKNAFGTETLPVGLKAVVGVKRLQS
jgi:hypothetical protein